MTPSDLLHSLVAVFPPEDSKLERSGALKGDRHNMSAQLPEIIKVHNENPPFALTAFKPRRQTMAHSLRDHSMLALSDN